MATFRSTSFEELVLDPSSPEQAFQPDSGRAIRSILVAWADRVQARTDFLASVSVVSIDASTRYISRQVPHTFPDATNFYAQSVAKLVGIGPRGKDGADDTMLAKYKHARLDIIYSPATYDYRSDDDLVSTGDINDLEVISEGVALKNGRPRAVSITARPGGRILVLNRGLLKPVGSPDKPVLEGIPINEPHVDWAFTWHTVPVAALPFRAWRKCIGAVNDAEFYSQPAGTLLCEPPDLKPVTDAFGNRCFDVQYRFRAIYNYDDRTDPGDPQPRGHNWVLQPVKDGGSIKLRYVQVTSDGTLSGDPLYRSADFTQLFEPDRAS